MLVTSREHATRLGLQAVLVSEAFLLVLLAIALPMTKVVYVAAGLVIGQLVATLAVFSARRP
jgi:succinate-acetate transporter protein